ncbi:hypothetical protein E2562_011558 [Oryza meyeriana var. granulata]|uniref:Uncharacterized protein n=1 Tax=Oryza meyeriana var. granulata TaxID=110450 RepID=A0A6G1DVQ8_9ORYZ|nr:hypothetical protein E2562_011558 [Oryza meyeriana var. granulata]
MVTAAKDCSPFQRLSPEAIFSPWRKGKEATSYIKANRRGTIVLVQLMSFPKAKKFRNKSFPLFEALGTYYRRNL